ncbi:MULTISPECIES: DUF461 domain-containing protein [Streptomyces]|uniref:DUF461 domain-containing protein n=1 Tax=Streptomyces TaxID=1883 RepID=UPI00093DDF94|nr:MULTISPECIES: DUF461 domain-containing protein [Streptomyces]MBX9423828.1 DUF461 domain-containing protein [Streptomyces lateritius]OKJ49677.1 hypothetical protein AMK29_33665 [Streptomyces sp. CB02261]
MSRSLRRGALAATALVFSIAALSACGAGNDAQTLGVRPDNAAVTVDDVKIQNALVITQPEAGVKGPAVVSATVFNNGDTAQTLESISLPGTSATVKLKAAEGTGPITVPAMGSVVIGGAGNATATIENGTEAARKGDAQEVVFKLSKTGDVGLRAFVVPASSYFKDFGPSIVPAPPGATPSASATPSGEGEHGGEAEHGAEHGESSDSAGH